MQESMGLSQFFIEINGFGKQLCIISCTNSSHVHTNVENIIKWLENVTIIDKQKIVHKLETLSNFC